MGHSTKVAEKHYLRVRKEHFDRAVDMGAEQDDNTEINGFQKMNNVLDSVQKTVQSVHERGRTDTHRIFEMPENAGFCVSLQVLVDQRLAEAGLELDSLTPNNIKELGKSLAGSGAKSGAVDQTGVQVDVRLLLLIKFWDQLPASFMDDLFERLCLFLRPPE